MLRRLLTTLTLSLFLAAAASAQDYPRKPIKLVVPFPPAGGTDIMARVVAQKVSDANKWTVVIDNRPGAGGNIGVDAAAKSPPDGYTLVMGQTSNLAINPNCALTIDLTQGGLRFKGIILEGRADVLADPGFARVMVDRIFTKYVGQEGLGTPTVSQTTHPMKHTPTARPVLR